MKSKILLVLIAIATTIGLTGCSDDPKITIRSNDLAFKAVNLSVDNGKLSATAGTSEIVNWTVNITVNGEMTSVSGTSESNKLPVRAGDELEILFTQTCPEQTEAHFTMPDGTTRKLTVSEPTFRWNVPENFAPGMQIKGESHYGTDDYTYDESGTITLIALE